MAGIIEPGAAADIVAVAGDPLRDIECLQQVKLVIQGGLVAWDGQHLHLGRGTTSPLTGPDRSRTRVTAGAPGLSGGGWRTCQGDRQALVPCVIGTSPAAPPAAHRRRRHIERLPRDPRLPAHHRHRHTRPGPLHQLFTHTRISLGGFPRSWRPHRTAPHRTAPHRTAPHRTAPHRTAPHRTAPRHPPACSAVPQPLTGFGGSCNLRKRVSLSLPVPGGAARNGLTDCWPSAGTSADPG